MTWLFIAAFAAVLIGAYMGMRDGGQKRTLTPKQPIPTYAWPAREEYDFDIVGESHYQATLKALRDTVEDPDEAAIGTAVIVPDNDNEYDAMAVKVTVQGLTIGHFSKEDARSYRRRLAALKMPNAVTSCGFQITGGHTLRNGETAHYGARLDIQPFE